MIMKIKSIKNNNNCGRLKEDKEMTKDDAKQSNNELVFWKEKSGVSWQLSTST